MRLEGFLDRDWTVKGEWVDHGRAMPIVGRHIGYRCDSCKWDAVETFIEGLTSIALGLASLHMNDDNAIPYILAQVEDYTTSHTRLLPETEHKPHQEQYMGNLRARFRDSLAGHVTDRLQEGP